MGGVIGKGMLSWGREEGGRFGGAGTLCERKLYYLVFLICLSLYKPFSTSVLFIETRDPIEPVPFVHHILSDLAKTQRKRTRYVSRLLPVQTTCNANLPAIEQNSKPILAPKFHNDNDDEQPSSKAVNDYSHAYCYVYTCVIVHL